MDDIAEAPNLAACSAEVKLLFTKIFFCNFIT